jgi:RNA polymerase sigma-70 factor (ECF subfamily)
LDDRELVRKLLAKDPEAERFFFVTYRDRLCKACFYVLGYQDPEAEDVVQESFLAAFNKISEFEFRSSLFHWLFRICMNRCYERIRARQRQIVRVEAELEGLVGPPSIEQEQRRGEAAETHRILEIIEAQREVLGDPCRRLLRLRDQDGNSYAAIAESLKIPIGTVMSRLSRCKEALKQLVLQALGKESHARLG